MAIGFSCRPYKKISSQVLDLAKIDFAKSTINAATFKGLNRIEKKNSQCEAIFKCNDNYCWLQFLIIGGHLCGYGCSTYELHNGKICGYENTARMSGDQEKAITGNRLDQLQVKRKLQKTRDSLEREREIKEEKIEMQRRREIRDEPYHII